MNPNVKWKVHIRFTFVATQAWGAKSCYVSWSLLSKAKWPHMKHLHTFSNKETSQTCNISFSAVSEAMMPSEGAFFAEFHILRAETTPRCETNEKQHFSGDSKPTRGARYQSIPRPPPLKSRVERSTSTQCLRDCTRGLQPSLRASIGADPLQNLHMWSSTRPNVHFQSWTESVLVSLSYEQYHFQVRQTTSKNRIFASGSFSAVSTNFSILSSLSGRIRPHLALDTQKHRNSIHKQIQKV